MDTDKARHVASNLQMAPFSKNWQMRPNTREGSTNMGDNFNTIHGDPNCNDGLVHRAMLVVVVDDDDDDCGFNESEGA